jgi:hypothetical protein
MIYIDADDFHETNNSLKLLEWIHNSNGMVFNLFTVPGCCSLEFIERIKRIKWIDMIPHGWDHWTDRECESWTYERSLVYIQEVNALGLTRGFKAPGWRTSPGLYRALLEEGYWICDHHDHDDKRPDGMKVFHIPPEHHFHIGGTMENRIDNHVERLRNMKGEFGFIKDVFK